VAEWLGGRDKGETRAGDGVARFMAMGWDLEGSVDRGSFSGGEGDADQTVVGGGGQCVGVVVSAAQRTERRRAISGQWPF